VAVQVVPRPAPHCRWPGVVPVAGVCDAKRPYPPGLADPHHHDARFL